MMHPSVVCLGRACERTHCLRCRENSRFSFSHESRTATGSEARHSTPSPHCRRRPSLIDHHTTGAFLAKPVLQLGRLLLSSRWRTRAAPHTPAPAAVEAVGALLLA